MTFDQIFDKIVLSIGLIIIAFLAVVMPIVYVREKAYAKYINRETEAKLKKAEGTIDSLQKEKEALKGKNKELERKIAVRDEEIAYYVKKNDEAKQNNSRLRAESESQKTEIARLNDELNKLKNDIIVRLEKLCPDAIALFSEESEHTPEYYDKWYEVFEELYQQRKADYLSEKFNKNPFFNDINNSLLPRYKRRAIFESILSGALNRADDTDLSITKINLSAEVKSVKRTAKKTEENLYTTSLIKCNCDSYKKGKLQGIPCKHMELLAYAIGYLQLNKDLIEQTDKKSVTRLAQLQDEYTHLQGLHKDLEREYKKLQTKTQKKKEKSRSSSLS